MNLRLAEIRKERGLSQEDMARLLNIKKSRYGTWERGERMMNIQQAYDCCVVLNCTLNDLVGMRVEYSYLDIRQEKLNRAFDSLSDASKTEISNVAQSYALDPSRRIEKNKSEDVSNKEAMGF